LKSSALVAILASASLFSCGPATQPAKAAEANITPAHIATPPGVALVSACTPTGPELCFNAIDDNCNGIIDEGCGVGTGLLQFTVAWSESRADVDLVVTDPAGDHVSENSRSAPSGLHLDRDCPSDGCNGQNVENVFLEGLDPPHGHYAVEIKLVKANGESLPIRVRLGARLGSRSYGADVILAQPEDRKLFGFDLL
jgi:hypothetical protein